MDMECNIPDAIQQGKITNKEDPCMKFYDDTQPLNLEADASGVRLGAALL